MIDTENISIRLEKLKEYAEYLKGYKDTPLEQLQKDHTIRGAIFHYLQLSIECVTDIGEILISGLKLQKPNNSREIIEILVSNDILPKELGIKLIPAVNFRNILVHDYVMVDLNIVYKHLHEDLADLDHFARSIAQYIKLC